MPCGDNMDARDESNQEKESLAGDVMESVGESREAGSDAVNDDHESNGANGANDPLYVQKRLKQQKRAHDREIRALHERIQTMQSQGQPNTQQNIDQTVDPYEPPQSGDMAEHIHKAVSQVLRHKEEQEHKAKEAERMEHVNKQYQKLHKHLDGVADKYDDFDDVVRGDDAPFTPHMRDAALLLPHSGSGSAGEVLYKLGKNRGELERIAKLHPLEQARELNALSHAMAKGEEHKNSTQQRPLGNIKNNPVSNSHAITEKTSPSEIRARMKAGKFK